MLPSKAPIGKPVDYLKNNNNEKQHTATPVLPGCHRGFASGQTQCNYLFFHLNLPQTELKETFSLWEEQPLWPDRTFTGTGGSIHPTDISASQHWDWGATILCVHCWVDTAEGHEMFSGCTQSLAWRWMGGNCLSRLLPSRVTKRQTAAAVWKPPENPKLQQKSPEEYWAPPKGSFKRKSSVG